jgi:hypothetical protein
MRLIKQLLFAILNQSFVDRDHMRFQQLLVLNKGLNLPKISLFLWVVSCEGVTDLVNKIKVYTMALFLLILM